MNIQQQNFEENYQTQFQYEVKKLTTSLNIFFEKNEKELNLLLTACRQIDSNQHMEKLFGQNIFKCDRKKIPELKTIISNFYKNKDGIVTNMMNEEEFFRLKKQISQLVSAQFDKIKRFENRNTQINFNIQTTLDNIKSQLRETVKSFEPIKQNQISLRSQLQEGIKKLLCSLVPQEEYQAQLSNASSSIAETLEFDALNTEDLKGVINQTNKKRLITIITNFKAYSLLRDYGNEEILMKRQSFIKNFQKSTALQMISIAILKDIIENLLKDPSYNWTIRQDLNDLQKKSLIQQLWLNRNQNQQIEEKQVQLKPIKKNKSIEIKQIKSKDKSKETKQTNYKETKQAQPQENTQNELKQELKNLMLIYKSKDQLKYKLDKDIKNIINYITSTCKINLSEEELPKINEYLNNFDLISFFDSYSPINASMKNIYQYMNVKCPDYMNAQRNQQQCSVKMRIDKLFRLRAKLFSIIDHFSYKQWSIMEENILNGNINIIDGCIGDEDVRFQFRNWISQNLNDYFDISIRNKTLRGQTQIQLINFFINKNIRSLKFKDIISLKDKLLQDPYYEVIQSAPELTLRDVRQLKADFNQLQCLKRYNKYKKIELPLLKRKAQAKIQDAISKMNYEQNKAMITSALKDKLIKEFIENPKPSSILEQKVISPEYKKHFMAIISQIQEVKVYAQNYEKIQCINKEENYFKSIEKHLSLSQLQKLKEYIYVFGEIPIKDDEKCTIIVKDQNFNEVLKSLNIQNAIDKRKALRQSQKTKLFEELKEILPIVSSLYLKQSKDKFQLLVKKIILSKNMDDQSQQQYLLNIIKERAQSGIRFVFDDPVFKQGKQNRVKVAVINQLKYQQLVRFQKSLQENKSIFSRLNLNQKIRSIYHHQVLINLPQQEKKDIIDKILQSYNLATINTHPKLTFQQKNSLITLIQQSEEFKACPQPKFQIKPNNLLRQQYKNEQINPEQIKFEQKRQESRNSQVQQNIVQLPTEETYEDAEKNQSDQKSQQQAFNKKGCLENWDNLLLEYKQPRSQYRIARANKQFEGKTLDLVQNILRSHPWTLESMNFYNPQRSFMKTGLIEELNSLITTKPQLLEEINMFKSR